jgi:hypothetical protein
LERWYLFVRNLKSENSVAIILTDTFLFSSKSMLMREKSMSVMSLVVLFSFCGVVASHADYEWTTDHMHVGASVVQTGVQTVTNGQLKVHVANLNKFTATEFIKGTP